MDAPLPATSTPFGDLRRAWGAVRHNYRVWAQYETVIVFDTEVAYRVKLPRAELLAHLTIRARRLTDTVAPTILLGSALIVGTGGLAYLVLQTSLIMSASIILAVMTGLVLGGPLAGFLVPHLVGQPLWVIRIERDKTGAPTISPIGTGQQVEDELVPVPGPDGTQVLRPQVYRATSLYEATKAEEEASMVQGGGEEWSKFEIGALATIAVISAGLLVLFAIASSGGDAVVAEAIANGG